MISLQKKNIRKMESHVGKYIHIFGNNSGFGTVEKRLFSNNER
jgi:hypothetical protein